MDTVSSGKRGRKNFYCPFYVGERRLRGRYILNCEGGRLAMPDLLSRRELVYKTCAHPDGWKSCPIAAALEGHYERQ